MIGGSLLDIFFSPFLDFSYYYSIHPDDRFNYFMCMIYGKAMRMRKKIAFRSLMTWAQKIRTRNREFRSRPEQEEAEL